MRSILRVLFLALTVIVGLACGHDPSDGVAGLSPSETVSIAGGAKITLTSIAVTPPSTTLPPQTTQALKATGTESNGKTKDLTNTASWTSSDSTVATVSATGLVTAVKAGTVTITATSGTIFGTATIAVTSATMVSVAVTPARHKMPLGVSVRYTATGTFSDGSTRALDSTVVSWKALPAGVATLGATGKATGVAVGTTTVIATHVSGRSGTATLTITAAALKSIAVTPTNPSVPAGLTEQFAATGTYTDGTTQDLTDTVTWAPATGSTVANVSSAAGSAGLASTVGPGKVAITATLGKKIGSTTLTVTNAVLASITVTPAAPILPNGTTAQLTATGTFSDDTTQNLTSIVVWSSSPTGVATVSNAVGSQGLVTSASPGVAFVTATDGNVSSQLVPVTVTPAVLTSIRINVPQGNLPAGLTEALTATGTYSDGSQSDVTQNVTWSVAAGTAAFASVSNAPGSQGQVTGLAVGTASILVLDPTTTVQASVTVSVTAAVLQTITVSPLGPSIPQGMTQAFTAMGNYSGGIQQDLTTAVTWTSSTGAASISNGVGSNGLATALALTPTPVTTIQATDPTTGIVGSTQLTVLPPVLTAIAVSAPSYPDGLSDLPLGLSMNLTATGTYSSGPPVNVTTAVTWAIAPGSPAVLVVSNAAGSQGQVTGVNTLDSILGPVTVTATDPSTGKSGTQTIVVGNAVPVSVGVSPATATVGANLDLLLTATALFSDGTTAVAPSTSPVWSFNTAYCINFNTESHCGSSLVLTSSGLVLQAAASDIGAGPLSVVACVSEGSLQVCGQASVTVVTGPPLLVVTPASSSQTAQQFHAIYQCPDGSTEDVTSIAVWMATSAHHFGWPYFWPTGVTAGIQASSLQAESTDNQPPTGDPPNLPRVVFDPNGNPPFVGLTFNGFANFPILDTLRIDAILIANQPGCGGTVASTLTATATWTPTPAPTVSLDSIAIQPSGTSQLTLPSDPTACTPVWAVGRYSDGTLMELSNVAWGYGAAGSGSAIGNCGGANGLFGAAAGTATLSAQATDPVSGNTVTGFETVNVVTSCSQPVDCSLGGGFLALTLNEQEPIGLDDYACSATVDGGIPTDSLVTVTSSNPQIATAAITSSGAVVTGNGPGVTTISGTTQGGCTATMTVTVFGCGVAGASQISELTLGSSPPTSDPPPTPSPLLVAFPGTAQLHAYATYKDNPGVWVDVTESANWNATGCSAGDSSSPCAAVVQGPVPAVIQFGSFGPDLPGATVTAVSPGVTTVTASLCNLSASATTYVPCANAPTSIVNTVPSYASANSDSNGQCTNATSCCANAATSDAGVATTVLGCGPSFCGTSTPDGGSLTTPFVCPETACAPGVPCIVSANSNTSVRYSTPAVNVCDPSQAVSGTDAGADSGAGGACNGVIAAGAPTFDLVAAAPPAGNGGTVANGAYNLLEVDDYTGMGGGSGPGGAYDPQAIIISGSTWQSALVDSVEGNLTENATVATGGNAIFFNATCGASAGILIGTNYSVSPDGTELDLIQFLDAMDTYVFRFGLQP